MSAKRVYLLLLIGLGLTFVGLAGATYAVGGMLQAKARTLADKKAEVSVLTGQQSSLAQAKRDIVRYADLEKITDSIVPQDKDQAQTVRELTNIAAANKVNLTVKTTFWT